MLLSLLIGGTLLGLWGMLLAVPTVACAKVVLLYVWDTRSTWPPPAPEAVEAAGSPAPSPRTVEPVPDEREDGVGEPKAVGAGGQVDVGA